MLLSAAPELSFALKIVVVVLMVLLFAALALLAYAYPRWLANRAEARILELGRRIGIALRAGVGLPGSKPARPCATGQVEGWHAPESDRLEFMDTYTAQHLP